MSTACSCSRSIGRRKNGRAGPRRSPSLGAFLAWIAGLLESGNVVLDIDPMTGLLNDMRLKEPPSTHFHDEARVLLGAAGPYRD